MLPPFVIIGLGLLPSLIWLIFYLQEDRKHPEPIRMIIFTFVVGGLITFFALLLQLLARHYFSRIGVPVHGYLELVTFSTIEEVLKFLAVFLLVSQRHVFNHPIDAMMYMIIAALGFAAVENIASLGQANYTVTIRPDSVGPFELMVLRFFGATVLHSVTSGIMGYHWAVGIATRRFVAGAIVMGLLVAILLHAIFNYLILKSGPGGWAIAFALFIAFFLLADFETLKAEGDD